jgi:membrane protein YqaA with SNARE-associated domain
MMTNQDNTPGSSKNTKKSSKIRTLLFIIQVTLVLVLLIGWLSFKILRTSKNLWVLFFYSFPSEFLIAIVPHEPILLYFGKFYSPLTVAAVGIIGTVMTEAINYSAFNYITDTNFFQKIRHKKTVNKIIELFRKSPFLAIWIAGLTPVPFYPFRFLVVLARYPVLKYLLAVFLSRTPRFYLLAYLGHEIKFPDYLLIILFVILILSMNIQLLRNVLKKRRMKEDADSSGSA